MDYLTAMRSFVRSVSLGTFSRAAEEAGVKVSTISRYVASLEEDLGAALLNRSTHGLHLTEIGRMFFEQAVRIVGDVDDARLMASSYNTAPQGCLKVTAPTAFGRLHVVPHLAAFLAENPAISIDMTLTDSHVDLIDAGVDLAVRIGALPDSGLIARKLAPNKRIFCVSPKLLASGAPIKGPADLANRDALIFSIHPATWHFRHRSTGERLSIKVSGRIRINDSEALLTCVKAGQGVAVLPTWLVYGDLVQGTLVAPLVDWDAGLLPDFDGAIWAVYPPKKVVSPKVRAFIGFLEALYRKPVYWEAERGESSIRA